MHDEPATARSGWLARGVAVSALVGLALGGLWALSATTWLTDALAWFQSAGPVGWVGFGLLYLVVTLSFLPTSAMTIGGGFLYGPLLGFAIVWTSENLAALACFVLGRTVARDAVRAMVEKRPILRALDRAMERRGFTLLVLLRHSPLIPFSALNYGMALTGISARQYVAATLIGTALPAFLYVYVGASLTRLGDVLQGKATGSFAEHALYWGGLLATVLATAVVGLATRKALNARLDEAGIDPTQRS